MMDGLNLLLELGHPFAVNVRGSTRKALWTRVYITSNVPLADLYPRASAEHVAALQRRIPAANVIYVPLPPPPEAQIGKPRARSEEQPISREALMQQLATIAAQIARLQ